MSPVRVREIMQRFNFEGLPKSFQNLRSLKGSLPQVQTALAKLAHSRPAEMSAHLGQTLLFLLVVTGVELVQKELKARGEGKPSEESLLYLAGIAAQELLNNGSTYMAVLGAAVADLGLSYPAQALSAWLVDPKSRPLMYQTLVRSIVSTGSLVGWEVGMSLWNEAAYLLETTEEYERSKSLFGMGLGALRGLTYSSQSSDLFDRKVAKNMLVNIVRVALLEQDLRSKWIDNTFRTRIMTGETALLAAVLTATGVGTMYLPGGGTVAGFIFGVVGIVIVINLPEYIKDSITSGLHGVRLHLNRGRLSTADLEIRGAARGASFVGIEHRVKRLEQLFKSRSMYRSMVLTIEIEKARMVLKHLLRGNGSLAPEAARDQLQEIFSAILKLYSDQGEITEKVKKNPELQPEIVAAFDAELHRLMLLSAFFMQVGLKADELTGTGGRVEYSALSPEAREFVDFIEIGYSRGFYESAILKVPGT